MSSLKFLPILFTAMIFFFSDRSPCFSQDKKDSLNETIVKKVKKDSVSKTSHSPKKASIFSACLPGLGQAYNRKYWKIPIIYAGIGTFGYFMYNTNGKYESYKNEYIFRTNNPNQVSSYPEYSQDQLKQNVDYYRRYRDLSVILMAAIYTLNIVDANVDAHMFTFDVSNDLSFHFSPHFEYSSCTNARMAGLSLTLKF